MKTYICYFLTIIFCLSLSFKVDAQDSLGLDAAKKMITKDLADIQTLIAQTPHAYYHSNQSQQNDSTSFGAYPNSKLSFFNFWDRVMDKVRQIQKRWEKNKYIEFQGFYVSLAVSPSITIRFKLKE